MKILETVASVREWRRAAETSVGLVPTMGFLHEGHLELVHRCRRENDRVAVSIFVNPSQFGPAEDLASYPRDLDRDLALLDQTGCDVVFAPEAAELYPPGFQTWVQVEDVSRANEGAARPGHFRGVATVVAKLLGIVEPTRAYFGHKDAQQLAVIRRLATDLNLPVSIVGCPTVRENDGLAMSSRNTYLSEEQREAAPVLHRSLCEARRLWQAGERDAETLRAAIRAVIGTEPLASVDYVSLADPDSFVELGEASGPTLASLAVRIGPARLIDNLRLDDGGQTEEERSCSTR